MFAQQHEDIEHTFISLLNDAFNKILDVKTWYTFEKMFEYYIAESYYVGHHQETILKLQKIMKRFGSKFEKIGIEINQSDSFLCNNNKKEFYERVLKNISWMNYADWHKNNIKFHKIMKKMNDNGEYKLIINNVLWVSHCKGEHMSPETLLRNNPDTLHARIIFQINYHYLFTCYAGSDCNGDTPGNTGGKHHRFLNSMTQNNYENRNLSYTKGLKWNDTLIKMSSKNVDINAAIRDPETNELTFTCAAMCGIFEIAFIFSVIFNGNELKLIQKEMLDIIQEYDGLNKNLFRGERGKALHGLRKKGNTIIEKTANELMDHIVIRTESIIEMMDLPKQRGKYKIQARKKITGERMTEDGRKEIYLISMSMGRGNKRKFDEMNDNDLKCTNNNNTCLKRQRVSFRL